MPVVKQALAYSWRTSVFKQAKESEWLLPTPQLLAPWVRTRGSDWLAVFPLLYSILHIPILMSSSQSCLDLSEP